MPNAKEKSSKASTDMLPLLMLFMSMKQLYVIKMSDDINFFY